jgi:hypothetical protein
MDTYKITKESFPITIGREGIDDYFMLLATGEKLQHPNDDEIREHDKNFPVGKELMIARIKYNQEKYKDNANLHYPTNDDIKNWERKNNTLLNQW